MKTPQVLSSGLRLLLVSSCAGLMFISAGCSVGLGGTTNNTTNNNNGNCNAAGGSNGVHCTEVQTADAAANADAQASVGTSHAPAAGTAADGTQLGTYSFSMSWNYTVVLGPMKPTYSQFTPAGSECDSGNLCTWAGFEVNNGNTLLRLPGGSTPSYAACQDAQPVPSMTDTPGTSFCVAETGLMVGVTVASVNPGPPGSSVLNVTVWRNIS